jgi:hypothetical protein
MDQQPSKSDYDDLNERLSQLENYVEALEERLEGKHQELADTTADHLTNLYNLNGEQGRGLLHKVSGSIQDADRIKDERFLEEFLSD